MSGIYIPGMEMPCSCGNCPMVSGFEICDEEKTIISSTRCRRTKKKVKFSERSVDCPLVPVPDHGRLIDADKIYQAVENRYRVSSGIEHRCERDLLDLICMADEIIQSEEVRHE